MDLHAWSTRPKMISNTAWSVVPHGGNSDHLLTPPSPFMTDASKIAYQSEEKHVHSVSVKINDAQELTLRYAHPANKAEMHASLMKACTEGMLKSLDSSTIGT